MLDPGALGTLVIGLDHVRREQLGDLPPRRPATRAGRRVGRTIGRTFAVGLHRLAHALEARYPAAGAAGSGGAA